LDCLSWPRQFGGNGWPLLKQAVLQEELLVSRAAIRNTESQDPRCEHGSQIFQKTLWAILPWYRFVHCYRMDPSPSFVQESMRGEGGRTFWKICFAKLMPHLKGNLLLFEIRSATLVGTTE
jgi:hypothetical protein